MTSWSEEFLGVSFNRSSVPSPVRPPPLDSKVAVEKSEDEEAASEEHHTPAAAAKPAAIMPGVHSRASSFSFGSSHDHRRNNSEVLHQLETLPSAVALAATAALQPQLEELRRCTGQEQAASNLAAAQYASTPQMVDANGAAMAVLQELLPRLAGPLSDAFKEALVPQLEAIVRHAVAASLPQHTPMGADCSSAMHPTHGPPTHTEPFAVQPAAQKIRRAQTQSMHTMPRKAFVVNFRRLIAAQKAFYVIHEFVKATAIAALTLVGAGNSHQLLFSVFFVCFILVIYGMHESKYDTTDITDFKELAELVEDDHGICGTQVVENPNRILKALTLTTGSARRRVRSVLSCIIFVFIVGAIWSGIFWIWQYEGEDELEGIPLLLYGQIGTEDQEVRATLLLVASLLLALYVLFEWLYWRETQCIMPGLDGSNSKPWDPKLHGVPASHRLLGLPSMWFTSEETYNDMRLWITLATTRQHNLVLKIFPEEMALYALDAINAGYLHRTLAQSKLYDVQSAEFLTRKGGNGIELRTLSDGETPEELGVDLIFYDNLTNEYLQAEDNYVDGLMHVLQRSKTGRGRLLGQSTRGFATPKMSPTPSGVDAPLPPSLLTASFQRQASKPLEELVNDAWTRGEVHHLEII